MSSYMRFFEVVRSDGVTVRVNANAVSAIMETQTKGGEARASIIMNNNMTIATRDLGMPEVWALFVEAAGHAVHIAREPNPAYVA